MTVAVIGAGASGLVAAIKAAERGLKVFIIERNSKSGKKLLLTGNGRCNYWNTNQDIKKYHSQNQDLMSKIINLKKDQVETFFTDLGIVPKIINGYYYPYSNQAQSILNALERKLTKLKVPIIYNELVLEIKKDQNFTIITDKNKYQVDKVIISTGSKANPKTGSDGNGYDLALKLGHQINKVTPSLVQVVGQDNFYKDWAGVRSEAILSLFKNGKLIKEEEGEVQFTDYGLSGICTFNLSGDIASDLTSSYEIKINLVPWFKGSNIEFKKWFETQIKKLNNYNIKEILEGFLNYKLVNLIVKLLKIGNKNISEIDLDSLITYLKAFPFQVKETKDFTQAQVCRGGIPLEEINIQTMESKIVKGLYFTGEILDVDGDCGGYNLGFAWMSGMIAGENV